ncbi:FAD/NAD(P)-binding domain-containing protein [Testicularia cyperi]|uniref:FAD/NAD(P)-binding domain-containing protein n=1 Tax=Testicularia cyperi TaxID=1882483 RepID=A0A317XL88_9BASI|nr:FAD/NAD(P)-binding domain-containing protein [Testicularia cyperi]
MSYKNIVVVGAATAGLTAAAELAKSLPETHRVILLEANPAAFWTIAALRASVQPGYEKEIVRDVNTKNVFGDNTRHIALNSTRVIDIKEDHVVVDRDVSSEIQGSRFNGTGTEIPIDRAILALGADYGFPNRISKSAKTKDDIYADFQRLQSQIKAAQNILVLGGGPTGVEFVGEVVQVYPEKAKNITLVTRGDHLISNGKDSFVTLSSKLISQLKGKGVNVVLDDSISADDLSTGALESSTTFTTEKGAQIPADFVFIASGGKPNSELVKAVDASVVNDKGQVVVNPDLSVKSSSPLWKRYFVVGDANDAPVSKTSYMAGTHASATAKNIIEIVKAEAKSAKPNTKPAPPQSGDIIMVPLGKWGGAGYLMFFTPGSWITGSIKGKSLFLSNFTKFFRA